MIFKNRQEAGKMLAEKLDEYKGDWHVVVYALPRGGVVVGAEIAKKLSIPLNVVIVKKISAPFNPEYAVCAISEGGDIACNEQEKHAFGEEWFLEAMGRAKSEINEKIQHYRIFGEAESPGGKIAILVDDGIATGLTMEAAIKWAKKEGAQKIIVAVPILPKDVAGDIQEEVDELVYLEIPEYYLGSVGGYYEHFDQVSDDEVKEYLKKIS